MESKAAGSLSLMLKFGNIVLLFFVFIDGRGDYLRNIGLIDVLMSVKLAQGGVGAMLGLSGAPFFFLVLIKESGSSPEILIDRLDSEGWDALLHGDCYDSTLFFFFFIS